MMKSLFGQFLPPRCLLSQLYHCTVAGVFTQATYDLRVAKSKGQVPFFTSLNVPAAPDKLTALPLHNTV